MLVRPPRYASHVRVVPLIRVPDAFHARVLVARLGSEGIVTQLRGGIDSPYPMGDVEVLVDEQDLDLARELLLADEVEAAFDDDLGVSRVGRGLPPWMVVALIAGLCLFAFSQTLPHR